MALKSCFAKCHQMGNKFGHRIRKCLTDVAVGKFRISPEACFCKQHFSTCAAVNIYPRNQFTEQEFCRGFRSTRNARAFGVGKGGLGFGQVDYIVHVKTGDQLQAGTDANVFIVLHSDSGEKTEPITLDYFFRNDFERGQLDIFKLKNVERFNDIHKIEIWRDDVGLGSDWFLDFIEIESASGGKQFIFPVFRWIRPHKRYIVHHMDNHLPQYDPEPGYRLDEMEQKRKNYQCAMKVPDGPAQVGTDTQ